MKWVRAMDRLPKENSIVVFRYTDTKGVFSRTLKSLRDENGNIGGLYILEWLDESPSGEVDVVDGCSICGGELSLIRGRYPNEDKRQVCPTCNTERLEQINEISSKTYGVAYKEDKLTPKPPIK